MSRKQVDDLQKRVGVPAPTSFREYLMEVGLFQDLTAWSTSAIEVYDDPEDFVLGREFLTEILPANKAELFPFGDDGAGNVYCLLPGDKTPCTIHFVDHETAKVSKRKDFTEWLQAVVAKVLRGIRRRPLNDRKAWCVQFSFSGTSYEDLEKLLRSAGKVKAIDSTWKNPRKTGGVKSAERRLEWNGIPLKVGRMECADWDAPILSFDMHESLHDGLKRSQIRTLNALFKAKCPGYALVDYGPLDLDEVEEDA
jgi:hypothetical protein